MSTLPDQVGLADVRKGFATVLVGDEVIGSVRLRALRGMWVPFRPYGAPLRHGRQIVQFMSRREAIAYLFDRHREETS